MTSPSCACVKSLADGDGFNKNFVFIERSSDKLIKTNLPVRSSEQMLKTIDCVPTKYRSRPMHYESIPVSNKSRTLSPAPDHSLLQNSQRRRLK